MTHAAAIINHYRARGFRHFELKRAVIRHARLLRALDAQVSLELVAQAKWIR